MRQTRARSRRGASVLEATLILPLFLIFWFGIVDWGITMWMHQGIVFNANQAARWAIVNGYDATTIKNLVAYGSLTSTNSQYGVTPSNVTVNLVCSADATCAYTGADDPTGIRRLIIRVSNYQMLHFTPFFSGTYTGRDVVVSLPTEYLASGG